MCSRLEVKGGDQKDFEGQRQYGFQGSAPAKVFSITGHASSQKHVYDAIIASGKLALS
jgi:hypothetical protein